MTAEVAVDRRATEPPPKNKNATVIDRRYTWDMPFTPRLVFVTASSMEEARRLARIILEERLAACVNLVPNLESHYWWQDKLETGAEALLLIKSSAEQFEALEELVQLHHSYDCPEIVAVDPRETAPTYRQWWEKQMGAGGTE
jgi:periplasmic divalent cation tolerance protein